MTPEPRPGAGGPNTAAGKARSSQNALRHGLAGAAVWAADGPGAARLAAAVAGPDPGAARLAAAAAFAAAQFELRRIRIARRDILQRPELAPPPSTRDLMAALTRLQSGQAPGDRVAAALRGPRAIPLFQAAAARLRELVALERYERRAFSRRQSAVRSLDAAAVVEGPAPPVCAAAAGRPPPSPAAAPSANLAERTPAAARSQPAPDAPATPSTATIPDRGAGRRARGKRPPREPDGAWERVATLAFVGLSYARIAGLLKISVERLRERFADALDVGPDLTAASLAHALLDRAVAGDTRAAIFFLRKFAGWGATGPPKARPEPTMGDAEQRELVDRIMKMATEDRAGPSE